MIKFKLILGEGIEATVNNTEFDNLTDWLKKYNGLGAWILTDSGAINLNQVKSIEVLSIGP